MMAPFNSLGEPGNVLMLLSGIIRFSEAKLSVDREFVDIGVRSFVFPRLEPIEKRLGVSFEVNRVGAPE